MGAIKGKTFSSPMEKLKYIVLVAQSGLAPSIFLAYLEAV